MRDHRPSSRHCCMFLGLLVLLVVGVTPVAVALTQQAKSNEELLTLAGETERSGGRLAGSLRAERRMLTGDG